MLSAQNVTFRLQKTQLLDAVNLTIAPGQVTAVIGPNGAGKTSLLKILSGEWQASVGTVSLQGRTLSQWPVAELAQRLAVLPQQSALDFPFLVEEVVGLGRYPHSGSKAQDAAIIHGALTAVDALHLQGRNYITLSGGEKQRVHLARVLAQVWQSPECGERYLLLDEPTSALDLAHQHVILKIARRLASEDVGVLIILHDLNLAAHYADQILMLKQGQCVAQGSAETVLTEVNIRHVFAVATNVMAHPETGKPLIVHRA